MSTEEPFATLRILAVDDDSFVLSSLLQFLEIFGHETLPARNGREAIQLFERHGDSFDLLITDICMPGIDGLGLIQHIRRQTQELPVIVITGYADSDTLQDIVHMGIPVFNKPVNFNDLIEHLPRSIARDSPNRPYRECRPDNASDTP